MAIAFLKSIKVERTLLWALVMWHVLARRDEGLTLRGKSGQWQRWRQREGRVKLTADNLSDLLVGYRSNKWSTRKRKRGRDSDREREKEISVVPLPTALETIYLVTVTRVLIINSSCEYSFTHTQSTQHAETPPRTHTHGTHTRHTHSQSVYLFCDFGGLLALRSLWRLQEIKLTYKKSSNLIFLMHKWIISEPKQRFQDVLMEISLTTHGITHL